MPNIVHNLLTFRSAADRALVADRPPTSRFDNGTAMDFSRWIPYPPHVYVAPTGYNQLEETLFTSLLVWAAQHWGTKWNAEAVKLVGDTQLRFTTAWRPPLPVLMAIFNVVYVPFRADFLEEFGDYGGHVEFGPESTEVVVAGTGMVAEAPLTGTEPLGIIGLARAGLARAGLADAPLQSCRRGNAEPFPTERDAYVAALAARLGIELESD